MTGRNHRSTDYRHCQQGFVAICKAEACCNNADDAMDLPNLGPESESDSFHDDLSDWGSDEEIWGYETEYYDTEEEEEAIAGNCSLNAANSMNNLIVIFYYFISLFI